MRALRRAGRGTPVPARRRHQARLLGNLTDCPRPGRLRRARPEKRSAPEGRWPPSTTDRHPGRLHRAADEGSRPPARHLPGHRRHHHPEGPRKTDPPLAVRPCSSGPRPAPRPPRARAKKLDRARDDLARLRRGLGTHHYPDEAAVTARLASDRESRRSPPTCTRTPAPTRPPGTHPGLALRPGRPRPRGRHRRLVRPAHHPRPRRGRRRRGAAPLQRPGSRRTPLRRLQGPPRRRPDVPARQPAHPRPGQRDLPGPARVQPRRTRRPPGHRPRHRTARPLRGTARPLPAGWSSRPSPACASSPPAGRSPDLPTPRRCNRDSWTCSASTPPDHAGRADRSEAILTSTPQPSSCAKHPASVAAMTGRIAS